jgi:glutamate synthase domain-containing protein 1
VLLRLSHRGACGCDERTGDGAGILVQLPDAFLREVARDEGIRLPDPGAYGVGMVFLPREAAMQQQCREQFEALFQAEGQRLPNRASGRFSCRQGQGWMPKLLSVNFL